MRFLSRVSVACLAIAVGLVSWPAAVLAEESSSVSGMSLSGDPFVVPGGEAVAGSSLAEEEAVKRASPEAVAARAASSSAYEGFGPGAAEKVADESFPGLVGEPSGGLPPLPSGQKVVSFPSVTAASLELPGGLHGVSVSQEPIAVETSAGQRVPVDLSLVEVGGGFQAKTPAAGSQVSIPKRLADGASLSAGGVGLTPVTEQGLALDAAEGVLDGAGVFYGDSEGPGVADVDTLIKPDTLGFSMETVLRSQRSPRKLFFKVGLPEGASLVQDQPGAGLVRVVDAGQTLAIVAAPSGEDAEGTAVPISMSLSGDVLVVAVEHEPGEYRMPIEVDPTVGDGRTIGEKNEGNVYQVNWKVDTSNGKEGPFHFGESIGEGLFDYHGEGESPAYNAGEWGGFEYATQGESAIYRAVLGAEMTDEGHGFENHAQIANNPPTGKNESPLETSTVNHTFELCIESGCAVPGEVTKEISENNASVIQFASRSGNYSMWAELGGSVDIVQTKNSSVSLDTS